MVYKSPSFKFISSQGYPVDTEVTLTCDEEYSFASDDTESSKSKDKVLKCSEDGEWFYSDSPWENATDICIRK